MTKTISTTIAGIAALGAVMVLAASPANAASPWSPYQGPWRAHGESLSIDLNGVGTEIYTNLNACPSCSIATAPQIVLVFKLEYITDGVAHGHVTTGAPTIPAGDAMTARVSPGDPHPGRIIHLEFAGTNANTLPLCDAVADAAHYWCGS
jgi:hypothetical protein